MLLSRQCLLSYYQVSVSVPIKYQYQYLPYYNSDNTYYYLLSDMKRNSILRLLVVALSVYHALSADGCDRGGVRGESKVGAGEGRRRAKRMQSVAG